MQNEMMRKEVLNRLKERPKTLSEISVEAKVSEAAIKDTIMVMMSEGAVSQDQERYFVPSGNGSPVAGTAAKKKPASPRFCVRPAWVLYFAKRNDGKWLLAR